MTPTRANTPATVAVALTAVVSATVLGERVFDEAYYEPDWKTWVLGFFLLGAPTAMIGAGVAAGLASVGSLGSRIAVGIATTVALSTFSWALLILLHGIWLQVGE